MKNYEIDLHALTEANLVLQSIGTIINDEEHQENNPNKFSRLERAKILCKVTSVLVDELYILTNRKGWPQEGLSERLQIYEYVSKFLEFELNIRY